jgi:hypothetical protein
MIDGDSSCMFLYTELEDGGASLGGYVFRVICVANLNGEVPEGVMSYAGEVETLPDEARAGELYKLIKYKPIVTRLRRSTNGLSVSEYAENQAGAFGLYYEEDSVISKYLQACINKDVKIQIDDTVLTVSVWNASNAYAVLGNYNAPEVPAFSDYITYWCEDVPCDNDEYASDWVVDGYSDEPDTFRYVLYNGTEFEVLSDITQISRLEKQLSEKSDKGHKHSAGDISSGTLSISRGGTGKSSWSTDRIIYPSTSTTMSQLAFPAEESFLAQKSSGKPYWVKRSEIGGASGAMVFKGVVDALPSSANEGDVYKLVTTDYKWSTHKTVINDNSTLNLAGYGLDCNDSGGNNCAVWYEVNNWVQNDNSYNPFLIKLCANGQQYICKANSCDSEEIPEEAGMGYTYYWGIFPYETISMGAEQTLSIGDTVEIYLAPADSEPITIRQSYVYHNGEWVEL